VSLVTAILLGLILTAGPLVLGGARLWIELPILGAVTVVLLIQAARLSTIPAIGSLRQVDAIDLSVLLFVLYTLVRWLTSPTEYFSRLEALDVVGYATIFLTCRYGLTRRIYGLSLVLLLVAVGLFETGFGYYLSLHSDASNPQSLWFPFGPTERLQLHYAPRWLGTYGCPNNYGSLLVMATGASLVLGAFSKYPWPLRIVFFYLSGVLLVGVMFSASRGSWIAGVFAVLGLTIFALRLGTMRWWVPVAGALALIGLCTAAFATSPLVQERVGELETLFETGSFDTYVRVQLAEDALHISRDYPLFGTGPGTFVFMDPRYQSSTLAFKAELTHDDYLNCLADYGLVGFGLAMFFVWAVTLKFFEVMRREARWQDRVMTGTGFAAWCALFVHSLFDFNMHIPANAMMLLALTGLALRRLPGEEPPAHWSTVSLARWSRGLGWALLAFGLLEGLEIARTGVSDFFYENAFVNATTQPTGDSISEVRTALAIDGGNAQAWRLLGDLHRTVAERQQDMESRTAEGQAALNAYGRALQANPLDDTIHARMGMTFDLMRRYEEAYLCYTSAVTAQPYDGQFWQELGKHFWQVGLLEKAEQAFLLGASCPHGGDNNGDLARQVQALLDQRHVLPPSPGTNPLASPPDTETGGTAP